MSFRRIKVKWVRPQPPRPLSRLANGWVVRVYDIGKAAAEGVVPTKDGWRVVWWRSDGTVLHPKSATHLTIVGGSTKPWTRREEVDWSTTDPHLYLLAERPADDKT